MYKKTKKEECFIVKHVTGVRRRITHLRNRKSKDEDEKQRQSDKSDNIWSTINTDLFARRYWIVFKILIMLFSWKNYTACFILYEHINVLFHSAIATPFFVDRSEIQNHRSFSPLVPIWGAIYAEKAWFRYIEYNMIGIVMLHFTIGSMAIVLYSSIFRNQDRTNAIMLGLFSMLILVTAFSELYMVASSYNYGDVAYRISKGLIQDQLHKEYYILSENSFTQSLNLFMIHANCCGIDGPDDFSYTNMTTSLTANISDTYKYAPNPSNTTLYWPEDRTEINVRLPPVCCKVKYFKEGTLVEQFEGQLLCAKNSYDETTTNVVGCGKMYHQILHDSIDSSFYWILPWSCSLDFAVVAACLIRLLQCVEDVSATTETTDTGNHPTNDDGKEGKSGGVMNRIMF